MDDILPAKTAVWRHIEDSVKALLLAYGYGEIRMPIVEKTDLFKRSIGEVTDIVEKEMYTFDDRNGESLTLRPEGTAGCVRAGEEHGLLYNQTQRLWYMGPMFRYEKPQKGRYRQFHQIGVEAFGFLGPDIDAELIVITARLWQHLGLSESVTLQLNSLGTSEARADYKRALVAYLSEHKSELDEDSLRRLDTNPLRILDSKSEKTQKLLDLAPSLNDYLDTESREHFNKLTHILDTVGIAYEVNSRLVRGLDYYGKTVFEWVTNSLGAQGTVCAGGRYDGLVEQLGGKATPAVGFAMGLERLVLLMESVGCDATLGFATSIYLVTSGDAAQAYGMAMAESIRTNLPKRNLLYHCGGGKFKKQMKKADESGAELALIIGDSEVDSQTVTIKYLRLERAQETIPLAGLVPFLECFFSN